MPARTRGSLLLLLSCVLSACSLGQMPDVPPSEDVAPPPLSGVAPARDGNQPVVITFGAPEGDRRRFDPLITQFNATNPDIEVRFVPLSGNDLQRQNTDLVNRAVRTLATTADTVLVNDPQPAVLVHPALADLSPFIDADAAFDRADFVPTALPSTTAPQRVLPLSVATPLLAYNQDLWMQRNLPPPQPDWRWIDLLQAVDQLAQTQGDTITVYGLLNGGRVSHAATALIGDVEADTGAPLDGEQGAAALGDPAVERALARTVERIATGALPAPLGPTFKDITPRILSGQAALWPADLLSLDGQVPFAVGYIPMPVGGAVTSRMVEGLALSSGSQHSEAGWRWLRFLSQQSATFLTPASTILPARASVLRTSASWQQLPPEMQAVQALLAQRQIPAASVVNANQRLVNALSDALQTVRSGQGSAAQALATAQVSLQQASQAPAPSNPESFAVATPPPSPDPTVAQITLEVAIADDPTVFPEAVQRFNATHPDILVTTQATFRGAPPLQELAPTADCFVSRGPGFLDRSFPVYDLRPLLDADATGLRADFLPQMLAVLERSGQQIGLPLAANLPLLGYNKALFDARGVDYPRADWQLDDFVRAAQRLTERDVPDPTYGFVYANGEVLLLPYMMAQGGASLVEGQAETLRPQFTTPKTVAALRTFLELVQVGAPTQKLSDDWSPEEWQEQRASISEGRAGMWFSFGEWDMQGLSLPTDASRVLMVPPYPNGPPVIDAGDLIVGYIADHTPHAEACWTLLQALGTDMTLLQRIGMPVRTSVGVSPDYQAAARPGAADIFRGYQDVLSRPASGVPAQSFGGSQVYYYWLVQALNGALQGKSLDDGLDRAQTQTADFLTCLRTDTPAPTCAEQAAPNDPGWLAN